MELDKNTFAGTWRAVVKVAVRENGQATDRQIELYVIFADFRQIPDDEPLSPAIIRAAEDAKTHRPLSLTLQ